MATTVIQQKSITPDLVAFSGQRKHTVVGAGFSRAQLTQGFVDTLLLGGWEILSGPTVQAQGNGYVFQSQQSPWYDLDNIPLWYTGNKIVLQIDNSNGIDILFRVGASYSGSTELMMGADEVLRIRLSNVVGFAEHILVCPYQIVWWSERSDITTANADRWAGCVVSALNNPKFTMQRKRIIHNIYASGSLRNTLNSDISASIETYSCFRTRADAGAYQHSNVPTRMLVPVGSSVSQSGKRIWNRELDLDMGDFTKWSPFFAPARIIYALPNEGTRTINGFLWDSIIVSEGFTVNTQIKIKDRTYLMYSGNSASYDVNRNGSSLFFLIDDELPE